MRKFVIFFDKKFAVLSPDIPAPIITVFKFKFNLILNIYNNSQNNLLFQSPLMYLPYDFIYYNNVIKCLDLCEYNNEKFLNFITILSLLT